MDASDTEKRNQLYDRFAHDYASHSAANFFNARYERPAMQRQLGSVRQNCARRRLRVREHSAYLLERGASVIAIDNSAAMIELVRRRFGKAIEAKQQELAKPMSWLGDGSVDLVLCSLTIHYLERWNVALEEFHRVLVPHGRVLLSTHHPANVGKMVENYFDMVLVKDEWTVGGRTHAVHFYHRPMQQIIAPIVAAGFSIAALVEPRLVAPDEALSQEWNERLAREPWFLIVDARKRVSIC